MNILPWKYVRLVTWSEQFLAAVNTTNWPRWLLLRRAKICNKYRKHWQSYVSFFLSGQAGQILAVLKKFLQFCKSILFNFEGAFSCFTLALKSTFWGQNLLNINFRWERIMSIFTILGTNLWRRGYNNFADSNVVFCLLSVSFWRITVRYFNETTLTSSNKMLSYI